MKLAPRNSLQWRLSGALIAVIVLTGAIAAAWSFLWALHDANEILDGSLRETARLIATGRISVPRETAALPGSEPENDVLVVPLTAGGRDVAGVLAPLADGLHTVWWRDHAWRVLVTRSGAGARVAIAQRSEARDEIARHSAVRTLIPLLLLAPLLILLVREVVRRTLAPVSRLARHLDSHPASRAAQWPEVDVPVEVQPFVHSIRRLLVELTESLAQQQRFVANAAHELRSPIAALHLQAANVQNVLAEAEPRRRLQQLQAGIARIQHLLEQLLAMARSQSGAAGELEAVDLGQSAREVLAEYVAAAAARGIDLGMERWEPGVRAGARRIDIAMLLRNVIGNAVKYCPPGSVVSVSVYAEAGEAVLAVADDGPGIEPEHLQRVFEPFYRAAAAGEPGSGLGLAIVAAVAQRLGGQATLRAGAGGRGTRFEYRQPLESGVD